MPVPIAAKAGIIAVSVAVAAAIAVYESPEIRRMADDLRRRIAIALHSLGDNLDPTRQPGGPFFNRPEDAEGFMESRGVFGTDQGVAADDETRRRQREELMYWNAQREAMEEEKRRRASTSNRPSHVARGASFDDFLHEDKAALERGSFVYNTGADVQQQQAQQSGGGGGAVRRRGVEGVRGLNASVIANPFGDEWGIEMDEKMNMEDEKRMLSPGHDETMSDIYDATPQDARSPVSRTLSPQLPVAQIAAPVPVSEVLFDFDFHHDASGSAVFAPRLPVEQQSVVTSEVFTARSSSATVDRELEDNEYMTAGQESGDRRDAYASIQAWAQGSGSNPGFYSPLPVSPPAPLSEPEIISQGALTPTDSASLASSGEDVGNYAASSHAGDYDVMSEEGDGIATPNSWSEVGSVISESDGAVHA
ncbi:hypothetical protein B0T17DRAFT_526911 [Bombardia bombarda]|uniref:Uncharacterized protein n=1 Tax=Bombardia bombarda TaxID=252184 RepID=A0AA39X9Q3_9PEZI|nr:hypothetical protein B0T17DRAFT_526911 [Bombardia bombarda]